MLQAIQVAGKACVQRHCKLAAKTNQVSQWLVTAASWYAVHALFYCARLLCVLLSTAIRQ
jgi:hypothetical protein